MWQLIREVRVEEEAEFDLRSRDFYRPPVKQIGDSIYDIKTHYMSKGKINVAPSDCTSHLPGIRDTLLEHLEEDSFLYKNNIVTGSTIQQSDDQGRCLPSLVVLMDSLALAVDIEISPRPSDVLCDILLVICGQPVIVLTVVDGDKDSEAVTLYSLSVARGLTTSLLTFMDEPFNIVSGVMPFQDMDFMNKFKTLTLAIAKASALFVPTNSLTTNPRRYEKIVTAFWAGVAQTTSVISGDGQVDTDYLRFLTKDQCIILLENINKSKVEVEFQTGTGATTLMLEVARRLGRLGDTLLVCRSQEERERLRTVYDNTATPDDLGDLSRYSSIVDETGTVTGHFTGRIWEFTRAKRETTGLRCRVEMLEKENANMEQMIFILSSVDRKAKLCHLVNEIETLKILDINNERPFSSYLGSQALPEKHKSRAEEDEDMNPETRQLADNVLGRLRLGLQDRRDLFPVLRDMMIHDKKCLLQAHTDLLEQARIMTEGHEARIMTKEHEARIMTEEHEASQNWRTRIMEGVKGLFSYFKMPNVLDVATSDNQAATDGDTQTVIPSYQGKDMMTNYVAPQMKQRELLPNSQLNVSPAQEARYGETQLLSDDTVDEEMIEKLERRLETLKMESDQQQRELRDLTYGPESLVEWEYNMEYLSQEMATLRIQDVIKDAIGEGILSLITEKQTTLPLSAASAEHCRVTRRRSVASQLRDFQRGELNEGKLMEFIKDMTTADQQRLTYLRTRSDQLKHDYDCPILIVGEIDETDRFGLVSCPAMTLNRERVNYRLAMSRDGQFLTNTEERGTDDRPDQFKNYWGTCSSPITLPDSPYTPTMARYWETNSRIQGKKRLNYSGWLLEMAVNENPDRTWWISGYGCFGWSVEVIDCSTHPGYCIKVWENGRRVSGCLSTIPSPTAGKDVEIKLGVVLDVGRGRLAFIDVNSERVLYKFDVTFRQPPYPMFGVWPFSDQYAINMQLVSGGEISITDIKKHLIAEALFSS